MYYHFNIINQLERIFKKKHIFETNFDKDSHDLIDLYDGEIYRNFLNTSDGKLLRNGKAFTFTLNTDGIKYADDANLSIWPVYLTLNEIKPEYRYCIENVIIAG